MHLASNFVETGNLSRVQSWDKFNKMYDTIQKPEIVDLYNQGMFGVDLLDQYLSYYRIFIKSKKWTLRVLFHFIDLAVCASFIEYKNDCLFHRIPKPKQMKLIDFKLSLGKVLTLVNSTSKRKHLDNDDRGHERLSVELRPPKEIRFDDTSHMPQHDLNSNASRCKLPGCTSKSRISY